jgi:serine/threonine-protein kinase
LLEINQIFNEKYKILKVIGKGGMGRVYLAEHTTLKNKWAIKEMLFDMNGPIDLLAEPNILKQLNHPALPRIVDIVEENNTLYIFMDYIDGMSLKQALIERKKFSEKEVVDFGKQLCEVFIYLHNHKPMPIIYRDMKPDNVMLTEDGKLKVIDFGIAREFKEDSIHDTVLGYTKGYAAPEQQNKDVQSDARTDIYSLGVTLYHLITGKSPYEPPYDFTKVREIDPSLSEGIESIIRKCVQLTPEDRYQSASELLHDLNNIYKLNSTYKTEKKKYIAKKSISAAICIGCLVLASMGFKTMAKEREVAYASLIETGMSLVSQHRFEDGIQNFIKAQEKMPKKIEGYREIARIYLYEESFEKCIDYIVNDIFEKDGNFTKDDQIVYILGTAYYNLNQFDKASNYFKASADLNPNIINYKRDFAVSLGKENKIAEAEAVISDIKGINGNESVTSYVQGEINSVKKNFNEAVKNFDEVIKTSSDEELRFRAYKSIAKLYENNSENFEGAADKRVAVLEKASNELKGSSYVELIEMLGEAYYVKAMEVKNNEALSAEFKQKSLKSFQSVMDMGYNTANTYYLVGGLYRELGDYVNSEKILKEAIELYPNYYQLYVGLATLYKVKEDKATGIPNYSKVVEYYNLAVKYSKNKEKDPLIAQLANLVKQLQNEGLVK